MSHFATLQSSSYSLASCHPCSSGEYHHPELAPLVLDPPPPGVLQDVCLAGDVLVTALRTGVWFYWKVDHVDGEKALGVRWVLKEKREENCFLRAYRCQSLDPFFVSRGSGDASRFFRYVCVASGNSSLGHSISVTSTASKFVHHHELHGAHRILAFVVSPITAAGSFIFHQSPLAVSIDDHGGIVIFDIERNAAQWLLDSSCASTTRERQKKVENDTPADTEEDTRIPYRCRGDRVPVKLVLHGPCTDAFCSWCKGQEKGPARTRRRGIALTLHIVVVRKGRTTRCQCSTTKKENPYHHHHNNNDNNNNMPCPQQATNSRSESPIDDSIPLTSTSEKKRIDKKLGGDSQQEILQLHILWSTNQTIVVDETVIHSEDIKNESEVKKNSYNVQTASKKSFQPLGGDPPARVGWGKRLRIHPFCVSLVAADEGRFILQVSSAKMCDCLVFLHGCTGERCGVSPSLLSMDPRISTTTHTRHLEEGRGEQEERRKDREKKMEEKPRGQRDDHHVYIRHWIPVGVLQDKGSNIPSSSALDMSVAVTSSGRVLLFGAEKNVGEEKIAYEQFVETEKKAISDWLKEDDDGDAVKDELERGITEEEDEILMGSHSPSFMRLANQKEHPRRKSVPSDTFSAVARTYPEYVLVREVVDVLSWFCSYPSMYMCLLGREDMNAKEMISKVLPRITVDTVRKKVHLHMLGGDHYAVALFEKVEKEDHAGKRAHSLQQQQDPSFRSIETSYYPHTKSTELGTFSSIRGGRGDHPPRRGDAPLGALNDPSLFSWGIARTLGSTLLNSLHSSKFLLMDADGGTSGTPSRGGTRAEVVRESSLKGVEKRHSLSSRSPNSFPLNETVLCFGSLRGKGVGNGSTRASFPSHLFVDVSHLFVGSGGGKIAPHKQEHVLKTIYVRLQREEERMKKKRKEAIKTIHAHPCQMLASPVGFLPYPTPQASLGLPFYSSLLPSSSEVWQLQNVEEPRAREQIEWDDEMKRDEFWMILKKIQTRFLPSLLLSNAKVEEQQEKAETRDGQGNIDVFSHKGRRGSSFTGGGESPSVWWGSVTDLFTSDDGGGGGGGFTSPFFQTAFNEERMAWEDTDHHQMRSRLHEEYLYLQSTMSIPLVLYSTLENSPPIPSHILALQERDRLTFEVQDLILRHREELTTFPDPMEKIILFEIQEKKIGLDGMKEAEGERRHLHQWRRHWRTPFVYPQGRPASLEQWQKYADERSSLLSLGGVGVGGGTETGSGWVWAPPDKGDKDGEPPNHSSKMKRGKRITMMSDLLGWCLGPWRYTSSMTDGLPNLMSEELWSDKETENAILRCREIHRTRIHLHNLRKINEKKKSQDEELRALRAGLSLP